MYNKDSLYTMGLSPMVLLWKVHTCVCLEIYVLQCDSLYTMGLSPMVLLWKVRTCVFLPKEPKERDDILKKRPIPLPSRTPSLYTMGLSPMGLLWKVHVCVCLGIHVFQYDSFDSLEIHVLQYESRNICVAV